METDLSRAAGVRRTSANPGSGFDGRPPDGGAAVVLDGHGNVGACTPAAEELLGAPARELYGRPFAELFVGADTWFPPGAGAPAPPVGPVVLRRRGDPAVEVRLEVLPLVGGGGEDRYVVRAVPAAVAAAGEQDEALVRALFGQTEIGLTLHDADLRIVRTNRAAGLELSAGAGSGPVAVPLGEVLVPKDAQIVEAQLERVARTGEPISERLVRVHCRKAPERELVVLMSAMRLEDGEGRCVGVAMTFSDITERHRAQRRSALVSGAEKLLLGSLDIVRVAQGLAGVLVPEYADLAAVDLTEAALVGEEPGDYSLGAPLRRVAVAARLGGWPAELLPAGASLRVRDPRNERVYQRTTVCVPDLSELRAALADDAEARRAVLPDEAASLLLMPLRARGRLLGAAVLWRDGGRPRFDEDDVALGTQVGARAGISLDNARRYAREHRAAEALQRNLLPQEVVRVSAAEATGSYVPAGTAAGVGGTWFDVIPLSSCRVAFVVGDVVGHGVEAAAAMGRLRTAVQTLSDMDLSPEELLTHLDDLVTRMSAAERTGPVAAPGGGQGTFLGSTCLYAVYDPITGVCTIASAGHPPPVLSVPGRTGAEFVEIKPGPPLGVGGLPFEPVESVLEPGTLLAFYTDKLLAHGEDGTEQRMRQLRDQVEAAALEDSSPAETGRTVLRHLVPEPPAHDVALLTARLRALPPEATATWEFPASPEAVSRAREAVSAQLTAWQLDDLAFSTELIVSELVTNSIRYAGGPVGVRLIRDKTLICEVSDPSQTQPRLRRALLTDEGGRGLFLVAQVSQRWGSRYTRHGKTIWTEQALTPD
ncbi:SpoIIE family protein phosphatase [Streptomyces nodosus]|uniref:SpoIIE family protein phosphatase n=1 Tax=Streptomyces nodosus TaxID=40318 RepID=UPI0036E850AA